MRVLVLIKNVVFYWIREGVITEHLKTYVKWGIVSLVSMDVLFAFSVSVIREMHYQFFYVSHVIAAVIMLVSVSAKIVFSSCHSKPGPDASI